MSLADVGAQTLLNRIVPARSIGPVTGVMESGKLVFEGAGSLLAPALLAVVGVRGALFVAGGMLPVAVALTRRAFARIDDRAVARVEVLELLEGVPLFDPLRVDALEGVAARLQTEHHGAGETIVRQGDPHADRWYLVGAGELTVEIDGFPVGVLERGSQFGERALLRDVARAATVRASTDVELYALSRARLPRRARRSRSRPRDPGARRGGQRRRRRRRPRWRGRRCCSRSGRPRCARLLRAAAACRSSRRAP